MEAFRQVACVSGAGTDTLQARVFMMKKDCIDDLARKQKKKEKVVLKKKLKLLKGLSKDLSTCSGLGLTLDHDHDLPAQVRGKMISEASEVLLKQLEELKAEEKELKRRRKQEKAKLKLKSHCEEEEPRPDALQRSLEVDLENEETTSTSCKTIQVCMGNKCKNSGGGALLEEFRRLTIDVDVVACKCMGKCKNGPNVRLSNSLDDTPPNPLFIGVGLQDVGGIVATFLAPPNTTTDLDLTPASL